MLRIGLDPFCGIASFGIGRIERDRFCSMHARHQNYDFDVDTQFRDCATSRRIQRVFGRRVLNHLWRPDRLTALLHGADDEVCAEAVWALECISGRVLGVSPAAWERWWDEVEAKSSA